MTTDSERKNSDLLQRLRQLALEMVARDAWSRAQLLAFQQEKLRALIQHAVASSPFYREALTRRASSGDVPLAELPTVTKRTVMDQFDRIVTDPALSREGLTNHLASAEIDGPYLGRFRAFATSGTTGEPGIFVCSQDELMVSMAANVRGMIQWSVRPDMRRAGIGSPSMRHVSRYVFEALSAVSNTLQLHVTAPISEMVARLNDYQPEVLTTYATIVGELAEEQLQGRLRINPAVVGCFSEVLTEEIRQRVRDAWGCEPGEGYVTTEVTMIASSRPGAPALEILEDLTIVEVVDEHHRPVPPGTPGAKLLLTNLYNFTQPLIRYELSDSVTLAHEPAPHGRPYRCIARIDGRSDDMLRLQGADGVVAVHPFQLRAPFASLPAVRAYQITNNVSGLDVQVVLRPDAAQDTTARVRASLLRAVVEAGAKPVALRVTPVQEIKRDSSSGAKLKSIVNNVPRGAA
jgi:phenylacetate-coenzyme A ligase PaaK-like adenylate-forming protein